MKNLFKRFFLWSRLNTKIYWITFKVRSHWGAATAAEKLFSVVSVHIGGCQRQWQWQNAMLSNRLPLPLPSQMGIQPIPWSCRRCHFCHCRCRPPVWTPPLDSTQPIHVVIFRCRCRRSVWTNLHFWGYLLIFISTRSRPWVICHDQWVFNMSISRMRRWLKIHRLLCFITYSQCTDQGCIA